jgi:serine/threonine protein kinase
VKKYLVMEYADGGTLRNYLRKNFENLTWNDKFNLAFQLSCAVSYLHDERIVHRDLVNIFIGIFYRYFFSALS